MKKQNKIEALVASQVSKSLEDAKTSATNKVPTTIKKSTKAKSETKKEKVIKETAKQQKVALKEKVISNKEVKWIYPEDCTDTLSRKSWRQQKRNILHRLENKMAKISDKNSKEFKSLDKEYRQKVAEWLKPGQTA